MIIKIILQQSDEHDENDFKTVMNMMMKMILQQSDEHDEKDFIAAIVVHRYRPILFKAKMVNIKIILFTKLGNICNLH